MAGKESLTNRFSIECPQCSLVSVLDKSLYGNYFAGGYSESVRINPEKKLNGSVAVQCKIHSTIQEYFTVPALPKQASFVQL